MKYLILLFIFIFSFSSFAIEFEDGVFPELATSSRALAMGNAFIAKTDDSSSLTAIYLKTNKFLAFRAQRYAKRTRF
jgi:hypothetical protein